MASLQTQNSNQRFEYLTFSPYEGEIFYFDKEVTFQYKIDVTHTKFLKSVVEIILNEDNPEMSLSIEGGGSGAFRSEENYNSALSDGSFTVYENFMDEDGYNDQRPTDLSPPTYSELQDKIPLYVQW